MNHSLRFIIMSSMCVASLVAMTARATTISGYFDDAGNPALISSNGFGDLEAAQFGSDDAVARNVAIYALDVTAPGTVEFASSGYAAGGAQPYLSIFAGSDTSATFVDSSYFDPNIDFDLSETLGAGQYLFAIGVYVNESFAENDPATGTLADGLTALGVPDDLGSAFYQLNVDSADATFTIAPATGIAGVVPQPSPTNVPEPAEIALVAIGMISMIATRRRRICNDRISLTPLYFNLFSGDIMNTANRILDRLARATFITCFAFASFGVVGASAQTRAALVRDTDNAALAPFSTCPSIAVVNGAGSATFLTVPAGKRFVLQHMSYFAAVSSGNLLAWGFVNTPYVTRFFIPINPPHAVPDGFGPGLVAQDASFPVTAYFEAGEAPTIYLTLSGNTASTYYVNVCIAGYYVTP